MEEKTLKVDLCLAGSQRREANQWTFTYNGEEKLVLSRQVQFYAENKTKALEAFKPEEVDDVWFDGIPYNLASGESQDYQLQLLNAMNSISKAVSASDQLSQGRVGHYQVNYKFILDECIAASNDLKIVVDKLKKVIAQKK